MKVHHIPVREAPKHRENEETTDDELWITFLPENVTDHQTQEDSHGESLLQKKDSAAGELPETLHADPDHIQGAGAVFVAEIDVVFRAMLIIGLVIQAWLDVARKQLAVVPGVGQILRGRHGGTLEIHGVIGRTQIDHVVGKGDVRGALETELFEIWFQILNGRVVD